VILFLFFGGKFLSFCEKYFVKGIFCNKFSGGFFFGKKVSLKNRFFWLKNHENLSQLHGCLRFFLLHFLDISNFG